ncbi:MAG: carboxymuconolactone decarboxylase family protein [Methylobacter sp.]
MNWRPVMDKKIEEMIALGVAYALNCQPCLEFHKRKATELGLTDDEMCWAIQVGENVRNGANAKTREVAKRLFDAEIKSSGCCDA